MKILMALFLLGSFFLVSLTQGAAFKASLALHSLAVGISSAYIIVNREWPDSTA